MKWCFLTLFIGLCGLSNAQNIKSSSAHIFLGYSPESDLFDNDTQDIIHINTEKAVIGLSYAYQLKPRFTFGMIVSYHKVPFSLLSLSGARTGEYHIKHLGFRGKYRWLNNPTKNISLSSGVGLGYNYTKNKFVYKPHLGVPTNQNETYTNLRFSISLIEVKLNLQNNVYLTSELNLGSPTLLSVGTGYKW